MGYGLRLTPRNAPQTWLSALRGAGDLSSVTWTWGNGGGGLGQVTWAMDLPFDYAHPALRRGTLVEVMDGAQPVGLGVLNQPGRTDDGTEFSADGVQREAEHFLAIDASGNSTSVANTAVDQAIVNGLPWAPRTVGIATAPLKTGDATTGLNFLNVILDSRAEEEGKWWSVDGYGAVQFAAGPTAPLWRLTPGTVDLIPADDLYAATLKGRYLDSISALQTATATDPDAASEWGQRQFPVDMTAYGPISLARANNRLAGILARGKSKLTFTDRVEVTPYQLLCFDGRPAPLSCVRAGDSVRIPVTGVLAGFYRQNHVDVLLGEVVDAQDGQAITIAPVDLAARTAEDVFAVTPRSNTFQP